MDPSQDGGGGLTVTGLFCGSCGAQSSTTELTVGRGDDVEARVGLIQHREDRRQRVGVYGDLHPGVHPGDPDRFMEVLDALLIYR